MAEILIKAQSYTMPNSGPGQANEEKDRQGAYKRGYPVTVAPDGQVWGAQETMPKFVVLKCPEMSIEQLRAYTEGWKNDPQFETMSSNHETGQYSIRIYNNNASVSGNANFDRNKVETWFNRHGATFTGASANSITFDVALWQTLQSDGFWERDVSAAVFTLIDYTNPTAQVQIDYTAWTGDGVANTVADTITAKGGTVNTNSGGIATFSINRQAIVADLQDSIRQALDKVYKRRRFYFSESQVSAIEGNGGTLTVTQAQLESAINDFLNE